MFIAIIKNNKKTDTKRQKNIFIIIKVLKRKKIFFTFFAKHSRSSLWLFESGRLEWWSKSKLYAKTGTFWNWTLITYDLLITKADFLLKMEKIEFLKLHKLDPPFHIPLHYVINYLKARLPPYLNKSFHKTSGFKCFYDNPFFAKKRRWIFLPKLNGSHTILIMFPQYTWIMKAIRYPG
jgi:hypothetical protein